jgi:hypothetical protein
MVCSILGPKIHCGKRLLDINHEATLSKMAKGHLGFRGVT